MRRLRLKMTTESSTPLYYIGLHRVWLPDYAAIGTLQNLDAFLHYAYKI